MYYLPMSLVYRATRLVEICGVIVALPATPARTPCARGFARCSA